MTGMKWMLTGLVALNLALAGTLALRWGDSKAYGFAGGRGDYAVVAGVCNNTTVLYFLDSDGQFGVARVDPLNGQFVAVGGQNVANDFSKAFPK